MSHQHYNIIANCWKDRKGKEMFGFMKKKKASSSKNEADFNPLDASSVLGYIKKQKPDITDEEIAGVLRGIAKPADDLDHLDEDGELPWGWVTHNLDIVNEIESEVSIYRAKISNAENSQDKLDALNEYMKFVREGKKRYAEKGECIGKYFEEFVCKSEETKGNKEKIKRLKDQLKK